MVLGFRESFNSDFYCSICECNRAECRTNVKELPQKLRSKSSYDDYFTQLDVNEPIDYNESKGVEKFCLFNHLENFNIFSNIYVDLMHDVFEGLIPSFLEAFFEHCSKSRIVPKTKIMELIRDFNYSATKKKDKPSTVVFTRHNFNQNAKQMHCLMVHLPFIFHEFREKLVSVWPVMQYLLQCIQIVCSLEIRESDIERLEVLIEQYLNGMKNYLKYKLKPKDHFFTHYPRAIWQQGPIKPISMLRFESKHKYFTDITRRTQNFIDITKTMADTHQLDMIVNGYVPVECQSSKLGTKKLVSCLEFETSRQTITSYFGCDLDSVKKIAFFQFNTMRYSKGLLINYDNAFFEIKSVFYHSNRNQYYLLCHKYTVEKFDYSLNSVVIKKGESNQEYIIDFIHLNNKNSYDKIIFNESLHIIADSLDVFKDFD